MPQRWEEIDLLEAVIRLGRSWPRTVCQTVVIPLEVISCARKRVTSKVMGWPHLQVGALLGVPQYVLVMQDSIKVQVQDLAACVRWTRVFVLVKHSG